MGTLTKTLTSLSTGIPIIKKKHTEAENGGGRRRYVKRKNKQTSFNFFLTNLSF